MGWSGVWLALGFALTTAAVIGFYRRTLGCVTGDMLGALIETVETVLFLMMSMRWLAGNG
jgi:adenosylcobinamide-GDP ribazoletransferase